MQETDHLTGQIVFANATADGVALDCLLGAPGDPGLPVLLVVRRSGEQLGAVVTGQLARWAHDGTTVDLDLFDGGAGRRVRFSAAGTVVVLEPALP